MARSLPSLRVAHKLGLIAGAGVVSTLIVSAAAINGAGQMAEAAAAVDLAGDAEVLVLRLDTRASELKVDGYKALVRPEPAEGLEELAEDVAEPRDLIAQLEALELEGQAAAELEAVQATFEDYISGIEAFVTAAISDQEEMRTRYEEIQAANDITDGAVGEARDAIDARVDAAEEALAAAAARTKTLAIAALLLGIASSTVISVLVARSITRRLGVTVTAVQRLGEGDLTRTVEVEGNDEVAQIATAVRDATVRIRQSIEEVSSATETLGSASSHLDGLAHALEDSATVTSSRADAVASSAEEVSSSVQTVAAGADQMGAAINEIAQSAGEAQQVAARAVDSASAATETMARLEGSSAEIGEVVKVITSIAEQTNLLALNATIEAARAGEAGKGFAVVANEVKELAQETARATGDIQRRVETIQADTSAATAALTEIGSVIDRVSEYQTTIAAAVEEQTATTGEISRSVSEAATGTTEIAHTIGEVAQAAQGTSALLTDVRQSSADVSGTASALVALMGRFRV